MGEKTHHQRLSHRGREDHCPGEGWGVPQMFRYPKRARWMVYNGKAEPKKKDDFGGSPHLGNLIYDIHIYIHM